jgi:hypothetical protein
MLDMLITLTKPRTNLDGKQAVWVLPELPVFVLYNTTDAASADVISTVYGKLEYPSNQWISCGLLAANRCTCCHFIPWCIRKLSAKCIYFVRCFGWLRNLASYAEWDVINWKCFKQKHKRYCELSWEVGKCTSPYLVRVCESPRPRRLSTQHTWQKREICTIVWNILVK